MAVMNLSTALCISSSKSSVPFVFHVFDACRPCQHMQSESSASNRNLGLAMPRARPALVKVLGCKLPPFRHLPLEPPALQAFTSHHAPHTRAVASMAAWQTPPEPRFLFWHAVRASCQSFQNFIRAPSSTWRTKFKVLSWTP
jgi:hypothetical protein